jgi:hypothetical protein
LSSELELLPQLQMWRQRCNVARTWL